MIGAKQFLHALNRQGFDFVDYSVAAVITLLRIALGIFIGKYGTSCFHHVWRSEVFARNQLQAGYLPFAFLVDQTKDFVVT